MKKRYELNFFPQPGETKIETISSQRSYVEFDLELTDQEKAVLRGFDLSLLEQRDLQDFSNFGDILLLEEQLKDYLAQLGCNSLNNILIAAKTMTRLSQHILDYFGQEHAWISLRPSLPNTKFKVPRWHQDGYFYSPYEGMQAKAVMSLKGPSTLFYEASEQQKEMMHQIVVKNAPPLTPRMTKIKAFMEYQEHARKQLAENVFDLSKALKAVFGHGTIFTVGSHGAIHSEPDMDEPRLFFSVLPGTPEQIAELYTRWNPPTIKKDETERSLSRRGMVGFYGRDAMVADKPSLSNNNEYQLGAPNTPQFRRPGT